MAYAVTITSTDGKEQTYACSGAGDQEALIYAGKVVEANADRADPDASVKITKDGEGIGPVSTVKEMTTKAV